MYETWIRGLVYTVLGFVLAAPITEIYSWTWIALSLAFAGSLWGALIWDVRRNAIVLGPLPDVELPDLNPATDEGLGNLVIGGVILAAGVGYFVSPPEPSMLLTIFAIFYGVSALLLAIAVFKRQQNQEP